MLKPDTYDLATLAITTALTNSVQTAIVDLDGMSSANIVAELLGAAGGTSISGLVQTTFDGGVTWLDIARFDFTTVAGKKYCDLQTNAAKAITAYAALAAEGVNDGLLGKQLRAVVSSVGTYANTTFNIRASVH